MLDIGFGADELALFVINDAGPRGHFLAAHHTGEHMERAFVRGLAHQPAENGGYATPPRSRGSATQAVLDGYRPPPLPGDVAAALARIVAEAEAEAAAT